MADQNQPRNPVGNEMDDPPPMNPRRQEHLRKHDPVRIDEAMHKFMGDYNLAAKYLGFSPRQIKEAVGRNAFLRMKWTKSGRKSREIAAALGDIDPRRIAEIQVNEAFSIMATNSEKIAKQLEHLEERIAMGHKARMNPHDEELQPYAFVRNDRGEPTEEAMLRQEYRELINQQRQIACSFANGTLIATKIAKMLKEDNEGKKRAPNGKLVLAFRPKGAIDA